MFPAAKLLPIFHYALTYITEKYTKITDKIISNETNKLSQLLLYYKNHLTKAFMQGFTYSKKLYTTLQTSSIPLSTLSWE